MNRYEQQDLYENLLKSIADPFFIISEDGTYLDVFGGTERTLYDDAETLKGRNIYDFMERDFAEFFMEQVKRTLDGKAMNSFEYQLATETVDGIPKNGPGGTQWFEARMYPLDRLYEGHRAVTSLILNITERKQLQQKLRELSYQDSLTKIYNRRFFFERFSDQLELYTQDKMPLSVVILDVDHFKEINDGYGHFAGDHVLKQLVSLIQALVGKEINLARFGGDEFIFSLEGYSIQRSMDLAEDLHYKVQHNAFSFGQTPIPLTISIGLSDVTLFDTDTASIIARADKALYMAKTQGRNRVVRL
jgi:diguanylate cyclase (GGDEF)-like protein/PAS domain S-box-containing protein